MRITLCGSGKFEKEFKEYNKKLSLKGHIVYSLAVYPSDESGKNWYTEEEKTILDRVHFGKIDNSDGILVLNVGGYIGTSTTNEIKYANNHGKRIYTLEPANELTGLYLHEVYSVDKLLVNPKDAYERK